MTPIEQAAKLEPCPFCGSSGRLMRLPQIEACYVVCTGCSTRTWDCNEPEECRDIWNRRTTLIKPLKDENNRLQKALEGADELNLANQQLADENKRLRRHVVSFLSMIENGILTYPEHHESRVKYTTDKAKAAMEQALTKPT